MPSDPPNLPDTQSVRPQLSPERGIDRVIVALDGLDAASALTFSASVPELTWVKVGLELFVAAGPEIVRALRDQGKRLFLDLKLHDIPATMAAACRQASRLGVDLLSVHASAGQEALEAAQAGALEGAAAAGLPPPRLLAVTVLTSWHQERFSRQLGVSVPIQEHVLHLAELAAKAGVGGCVCSPQEVAALRRRHPAPFSLVTPGVRPLGSDQGDQARVMTPAEALAAGATKLVIGRPITRSDNPAAAFAACCQSISGL